MQSEGVVKTVRFIKVRNFLQAKALLEHRYVVYIGDPFSDLPLYACLLEDDTVIFAEYMLPNAAILRSGDWSKFEKLYYVAEQYDTPMFSIM